MKKIILLSFSLLIIHGSYCRVPYRYIFDFGFNQKAIDGSITISWDINRVLGDDAERANEFRLAIVNIFDDTLHEARVDKNYYSFSTNEVGVETDFLIVYVRGIEPESKDLNLGHNGGVMALKIIRDLPVPSNNWIDSLNFYLTLGCSANVTDLLMRHNRQDLRNELLVIDKELWPVNYKKIYDKSFNVFLDTQTMEWKKMPTVFGMNKLIKGLNKAGIGKEFIWVEMEISYSNELINSKSLTKEMYAFIAGHLSVLKFDRKNDSGAKTYLIIRKPKDTKKYRITNKNYIKRNVPGFFNRLGYFFYNNSGAVS